MAHAQYVRAAILGGKSGKRSQRASKSLQPGASNTQQRNVRVLRLWSLPPQVPSAIQQAGRTQVVCPKHANPQAACGKRGAAVRTARARMCNVLRHLLRGCWGLWQGGRLEPVVGWHAGSAARAPLLPCIAFVDGECARGCGGCGVLGDCAPICATRAQRQAAACIKQAHLLRAA